MLPARRLRLHHRIVVPFVLVAVVTTSVAAFVALSLIRRALESRVVAQLLNTSANVSRSDFALNAAILRTVKEITGADVITYTTAGSIAASTLDGEQSAALLSKVTAPDATHEALAAAEGTTIIKESDCAGVPCYLAYRRVAAKPDTIVALIARTSEVNAATAAMTRTILLSAGLGLVVMVFVSQIVARRLTAPIERLVTFTHDVSPGGSRRRAPAGDDEIGRLATAFNDMLDRLDQARDALVRSEKLAVAGLLAARVAHDIRNPLSSIKMQAQLLRAQLTSGTPGGDESARELVDAVLHDVDQLESVIRGLLELAKPGELKLRDERLNDVVRAVLGQLAPQLSHRKIAVSLDLAPDLPPLQLDAERFKQALLNVVVNAAEAMPQGGILTVATRADSSSSLALEVGDDGVGVDPSVADRAFDPFVSTKREGVGLGLVNTKAVVENHGGTIRLMPRDPRGTLVTISLPIHG